MTVADKNKNIQAAGFKYGDFRTSVIKDFKGVFHHQHNFPLPNNWRVEIIPLFFNDSFNEKYRRLYDTIVEGDENWNESGSKDIFEYKLKSLAPTNDGGIKSTNDINEAQIIGGIINYHKKLPFLVIAVKGKVLSKVAKEMAGKRNNHIRKKKGKAHKKQIAYNRSKKRNRKNKKK